MLNKLFSNEKAVSPVIGVMLMIVVTVILAAAVSSYASSVKTQDAAPQATFTVSCDGTDGIVTLEHLGGDTIYKRNVKVEIASGFPLVTGYLDSDDITFSKGDYLGPGDMATIKATGDAYGVTFNGEAINNWIGTGDSFKLTLIDTQTGQTIYSTNVIVNP